MECAMEGGCGAGPSPGPSALSLTANESKKFEPSAAPPPPSVKNLERFFVLGVAGRVPPLASCVNYEIQTLMFTCLQLDKVIHS